jgi:hypothetical protein
VEARYRGTGESIWIASVCTCCESPVSDVLTPFDDKRNGTHRCTTVLFEGGAAVFKEDS